MPMLPETELKKLDLAACQGLAGNPDSLAYHVEEQAAQDSEILGPVGMASRRETPGGLI